MSEETEKCATCGSARVAGDSFCEECGSAFAVGQAAVPAAPARAAAVTSAAATSLVVCGACGSVGTDADGYCLACGVKQPSARDHFEIDLGTLAGVCDRGVRHPVNQDAMDMWSDAAGGTHVMVVCDGVSSSVASDVASLAAARAATASIVCALTVLPWSAEAALTEAAAAAQAEVVATPFSPTPGLDAPSCTFVAAVVRDRTVTVAWLGDSRAYWLGATGTRQLSVDDSWATAMVRGGLMTAEAAEADNRAHQITRWLGTDAPDVVPGRAEFTVEEEGLLLLCSDGLWNYASAPEAIDVLTSEASPPSPIEQARHLCDFANKAGGHDNITVVVCRVAPSLTATAIATAPATATPSSPEDLS